jgi:hypothetical protein
MKAENDDAVTTSQVTTDICPNCGSPTPANYCPNCGQRAGTRRITVGQLIREFVDDQLALNSALPHTLRALIRPGMLTQEYIDGRIARYIPPFRLYLLASFLFFFGLAVFGRGELNIGATSTANPPAAADSVAAVDSAAAAIALAGREEADSTLTRIARFFGVDARPRLERLSQYSSDELSRMVQRDFMERIPVAVFLLVPIFAAVLGLLQFGRGRLYVEHFIFALHVHAFVFLLLTLRMPLRGVPVLPGALMLLVPLYLVLAMRRFYRQGWLVTSAKAFLLATLYGVTLIVVLVATVIVSLLMLSG